MLEHAVVIHPLDPADAAALIPMRAATRAQKGAPWRTESRKFFDALMEGVSPRADVTVESATVGGVPGIWVLPSWSRSDEAILHVHGGWFNAGSATAYGTAWAATHEASTSARFPPAESPVIAIRCIPLASIPRYVASTPHGFVASIGTLKASAPALDAVGTFLTDSFRRRK